MARGFESKDVEFQQAEAERIRTLGRSLTPEERDAAGAKLSLELALTRARTELAATTSSVRREMLSRAIADLEEQLARVSQAGLR